MVPSYRTGRQWLSWVEALDARVQSIEDVMVHNNSVDLCFRICWCQHHVELRFLPWIRLIVACFLCKHSLVALALNTCAPTLTTEPQVHIQWTPSLIRDCTESQTYPQIIIHCECTIVVLIFVQFIQFGWPGSLFSFNGLKCYESTLHIIFL